MQFSFLGSILQYFVNFSENRKNVKYKENKQLKILSRSINTNMTAHFRILSCHFPMNKIIYKTDFLIQNINLFIQFLIFYYIQLKYCKIVVNIL